ncbi:MAG TPA: formate dehydrogenase accessory sulfurtransferase FdhD [Anaeromyxobacteraceae bacterium]|nr:formate dehydrogenase accessory sulfurtransferase FdhD [Anaeromyxobacteraceae bacterium]
MSARPASEDRLLGRVERTRVHRAGREDADLDLVAVEEPLEIRFAGKTVAVVMRTPGDDQRLALGYLFGEGVIHAASDVDAVFRAGAPADGYGDVIDVSPTVEARIDAARLEAATRRRGLTTSACGVCGRSTVEDLLAGSAPVPPGPALPAARVAAAVEALRGEQPIFDATGGVHCAALWTREGALVAAHEDVGRHNAVDKVVGALLLSRAAGEAVDAAILSVSGRAGFEIVQKAARAGIPVVGSVSAPTSLAVALAREAGLALAGFVRGARMNVYSAPERILF